MRIPFFQLKAKRQLTCNVIHSDCSCFLHYSYVSYDEQRMKAVGDLAVTKLILTPAT